MKKRLVAMFMFMTMAFGMFGCSEEDIVVYNESHEMENVEEDNVNEVTEEVYNPVSEVIYPAGKYEGTILDAYVDENGEYFGKFSIQEKMYISIEEYERITQMKTGDTFVFPDAYKWPEDLQWRFYKYDDHFGKDYYIFTSYEDMLYDDEDCITEGGYNGLLEETVYLVSGEYRVGDKITVYTSGVNDGKTVDNVYYYKSGPENAVTLHIDKECKIYVINQKFPEYAIKCSFSEMYNDPSIKGEWGSLYQNWRDTTFMEISIDGEGDVYNMEEHFYS